MITKRLAAKIAVTSVLTLIGLNLTTFKVGNKVASTAQAASIPFAVFNNYLYQSHRGMDNNIYFRASSDGTNWSSWQKEGTSGYITYSAPAMAVLSYYLYLASRTTYNDIYIRTSDNYSLKYLSFVGKTYSAPAMATFNGKVYLAYRGIDNIIYTRYSSDGANWTAESPAPGATYSAPAMAAFNGKLYQAHRGTDNIIYTRYSSDGINWSSWYQAPGRTYIAPTMAAFNGKLYQAHRGTDNSIYTRYSSDGANWSSWIAAPATIAYSPAAMQAFNGRLYQSHQGLDNKIYTRSTADGINWTGWTAPDGAYTAVEAEDLEGTPGPGNLLSLSVNQKKGVLGVNSFSGRYSSSGNKFVASHGTGGTSLLSTDYAYGRALEKGLIANNQGIGSAISGEAGWWDDNIKTFYPNNIGSSARSNSIALWDPYQGGAGGQGHVAFVEAVFKDGSFLISESNWGSSTKSYNLRQINPGTSAFNSAKFIYLR